MFLRVRIWINLLVLFVLDVCLSKECGPPPRIDQSRNNGTGDQVFSEGTAVQYFCDFSTMPYGWPIYTCKNGDWTNEDEHEFYCTWKTCGSPVIEHGSYTVDSYTVGNFAEFKCDRGYRLKGSSMALCRIDRKWRRLPKCKLVRCPSPTGISHMDRFQNTHGREHDVFGNEIYNTCDDGFKLIGPAVQTCENHGEWTTPIPSCERIRCGEPDVGNGGQAYYDHTHLMSMAMIECDDDAIFKGEEFIVCYEDGWSYGYCYGACDVPPIENGGTKQSRIKHNVTLEWSCDRGYFKATHDQITCNDGRLTEKPSCTRVKFNNAVSCPSSQDQNYSVSRYHDNCYIFINAHDTYADAKKRCRKNGWSMLTIHDALEAEFIRMALQRLWTERTWLGVEWQNGQWQNFDGSPLIYHDWFRGEGGKGWFRKYEKCAVIEKRRSNRRWNDLRCHRSARVACVTKSRD